MLMKLAHACYINSLLTEDQVETMTAQMMSPPFHLIISQVDTCEDQTQHRERGIQRSNMRDRSSCRKTHYRHPIQYDHTETRRAYIAIFCNHRDMAKGKGAKCYQIRNKLKPIIRQLSEIRKNYNSGPRSFDFGQYLITL